MAIYNGGLSIKNVSIGTATGSGNAITSLSADGNVITPDKGSTFLTAQDISSKEDKSNKVTAWSSTTTDAHYPSEKLVKSALDDKAGKSEIEASVTTDSLTAGAIIPKGSASIGSDDTKFGKLFVSYINNVDAKRYANVKSDGVMEIGAYLDFHASGDPYDGDYTCRISATDNGLRVYPGIYGAVFN